MPDLGWDTIVARTFVLALVAGVALTGAYLALNPPPVAGVALPEGRRAAHRWEWGVPVGDRRRAVRRLPRRPGHGDVGRPRLPRAHHRPDLCRVRAPGLRAAHRRHLPHRGRRRPDDARRRARHRPRPAALRLLLGALCVLTLAVVASALYRMSLYQDAFGYTVLRVFVDGFELWLGLVDRVPPRRRGAAERLVGAARGARLRRRLRAGLRGHEPGRLGRRPQHRPVRGRLEPRHRLPVHPRCRRDAGHRRPAARRDGLLHHLLVVGHPVRDRRLAGLEPRPQPGRGRSRHVASRLTPGSTLHAYQTDDYRP